jgi:hypothetical protein
MSGSFVEEVESGNRLRALEALRGELARAIDSCTEAGDLSSLALRLQRVLAEIHELGGKAADEEKDALAERRRRKLSAASGP